ncbi:MarR family winged helix-turn-helix transcriptional regulator [uncultured Microbacterium sp.]|uniref:MarR family winged helix-turn-helix transcriptional regulator n=1 Tax=uncultured Microbacterium sp. TaxID=191216 RepID=UPI0035C9CB8D
MSEPASDPPAISAGAALIRMATVIRDRELSVRTSFDLTAVDLHILRLSPGLPSMGALVTSLNAPKSTITSAVKRLEARGLVVRGADESDRRRYIVSTTARGMTRLAEVEAALASSIKDIVDVLPAERRNRLTALLSRIPDSPVSVA